MEILIFKSDYSLASVQCESKVLGFKQMVLPNVITF